MIIREEFMREPTGAQRREIGGGDSTPRYYRVRARTLASETEHRANGANSTKNTHEAR